MMYGNNHMTTGGWVVSIFAAVILLALVGATAVWISRRLRDRRDARPVGAPSAREILDRRLANGEIKTDQYVELRRTLVSPPEPAPPRHERSPGTPTRLETDHPPIA
jgi:uncharacterized membrane protein